MGVRRWLWAILLGILLLVGVEALGSEVPEEAIIFRDKAKTLSQGDFPAQISRDVAGDLESLLLTELQQMPAQVDITSFQLSPGDFHSLFTTVLDRHPELFFVTGGYSYYMIDGCITRFLPEYKYTAEELPAWQAVYRSGLNAILSYANQGGNTVARLLRAHDYICANYQYDRSYSIYSPEEMFKYKKGVCQAYTMIFRAVLNEMGLGNSTAVSHGMNHTWNMVRLNGNWYHIDVTWDDPLADIPLRAMHDCFLVSDSRLKQKSHYGWSGSIHASDTRYDYYFWQNINQAMAVIGNKAYYMSQSFTGYWRTVHCFDLGTGTDTEVYTFFYGMGGYDRKYTPVWVWQDILYYPIRNELYAVPLSGGTAKCVFETGKSSEWIFYMLGQGSTLNLYGAASAYVSGHKYSITMTTSYSLALDQEKITLLAGDTAQLTAVLTPENPEAEILWSSGNENVAKVENGLVTAVGPGLTEITAQYDEDTLAKCTVLVRSRDAMTLPPFLQMIEEEAFAGMPIREVILPEGIAQIGAKAFASCGQLSLCELPESLTQIAPDAFEKSVLFLCREGTYAHEFAVNNGYAFFLTGEE